MKYSVSNTINLPIDVVMEKLNEPDGMLQWMEGLQKVEPISGTPGEEGAISDLHFLHKKKEMKLRETILEQNLPDRIKFSYHSPMGYNEVELQFESLTPDSVKQTNTSYFELKGAMKIFGFLFKGMFKKQSLKYLDAFKAYAEK